MESMLGFIAFIIFLAIISLAINAGLLMLATRLAGVRVPSFGRAVLIVIVAGLAILAFQFILGIVVRVAMGAQVDPNSETFGLIVGSLSLLATLFVNAWIYSAMLPTSYVKGLIIYIIQVAIVFAIAFSIAMIIILVGGSIGFMNN